jgi:DNA polymerase III epsilon subunit-like protein
MSALPDVVAAEDLPCVVDIEASGFGRGSYPIEIGFALPNGQSVCTLVRPAPEWTHWDGKAERLHGLTRELLARHGKSAVEVADLLNRHLAGRAVYCDGWAHDYAWIATLFEAAERMPRFRLRHVYEMFKEGDAQRWDALCDRARASLQFTRHRASGDALVLQRALAVLQRERG